MAAAGVLQRFAGQMSEGLRQVSAQLREALGKPLPEDLARELAAMERALAEAGYSSGPPLPALAVRSAWRGMAGDPCGGVPVSGPARISPPGPGGP